MVCTVSVWRPLQPNETKSQELGKRKKRKHSYLKKVNEHLTTIRKNWSCCYLYYPVNYIFCFVLHYNICINYNFVVVRLLYYLFSYYYQARIQILANDGHTNSVLIQFNLVVILCLKWQSHAGLIAVACRISVKFWAALTSKIVLTTSQHFEIQFCLSYQAMKCMRRRCIELMFVWC